MIFKMNKVLVKKSVLGAWAFAGLMGMGSAALAGQAFLSNSSITKAEAQAWAKQLNEESRVKVFVDDKVLEWLNRFMASDRGREFIDSSIERMQQYHSMIDGKISDANLPKELISIALAESGFVNHPRRRAEPHSAGIWQFIPSTARHYGLRVDDEVDERLDTVKATDAALDYLGHMHNLFNDWRLAIAGYNQGESRVALAIEEAGTRDPTELMEGQYLNDYIARVMAVILILNQRT